MEQKNNVALFGVVFLAVGLLVGWLIWGAGARGAMMPRAGMHQMSSGDMMRDEHMGMSMEAMMEQMAASLRGKSGDAFDEAFLDEMVVHHQGAVAMAEEVLKTSKRPELLKLAQDIISAQTKEIGMMQGWKRSWFGQ